MRWGALDCLYRCNCEYFETPGKFTRNNFETQFCLVENLDPNRTLRKFREECLSKCSCYLDKGNESKYEIEAIPCGSICHYTDKYPEKKNFVGHEVSNEY